MIRTNLLALSAVLLLATSARAEIDAELLAGMKARSIGPAVMSGRVAAVEALVSDPDTIYVGAATGGLWKSVDGGFTFEPIFDDQPVAAIGAVAVFQPAPDLVWVGTGEGNPRNSASVGNGVYKSIDGGRSWTHLGLEKSERIHRIVLHPQYPSSAWVCALGPTWGEGEERGVFKTVDGGESWQRVLYVDERTGCADLAIDPSNPMKLFAAMWDHRRWPWFFRSGGPGSGLWVSHDGGASWTRRTPEDGLPEGDLGRIGVAVAPSDPRIVYAVVEAEGAKNFLLRSEDGGVEWKTVANSADQRIGNRPFYYSDLRVDPQNPNRVYSLWSLISASDDGGKSWEVIVPFRAAHPDHHAMWINPRDPEQIIEGNDGGVYISRDRGRSWRFVTNLPLAQYYHLRVDDDTPYNVYGGLQDNGSWRGPSEVWENGGIRAQHWQELYFGDGFDVIPDPQDSMQGYAMSQEGYLARWNLRTGERKSIRPAAPCWGGGEGEPGAETGECPDLRFNWNAGIALDPHDPEGATLYFGSQYVHRSTDRGETWSVISPDLTTDNPEWQKQAEAGGLTPDVTGAENYTSILAIAPSPIEPGLIWVGTDDGRVQVTRDGGESWTSVEKNVRGVPANTWVPHIEPSRFDPAEAFVVFDDHRRSNWTPYVYRTRDFGRSWTALASGTLRGYALAIAQDPVDRDLLFLGTEFGLWFSVDGGSSWRRWTHGVPTVSVMDLVVHPSKHDLVLGTHGRAIFILDDVSPLRGLSAEILAEPLHLFPAAPAQQYRVGQTGASRFPGSTEFRGENRPYGALLTYSLNLEGLPHPKEEEERRRKEEERARVRAERARAEAAGPVSEEERPGAAAAAGEVAAGPPEGGPPEDKGPKVEIEVRDAAGELIRTFKGPAKLGVNRAVWDLRADAPKEPPRDLPRFFEPRGPDVLPGSYTVTLKHGEREASTQLEVLADPRFELTVEERQARWRAERRAGRLQETVTEAIERLHRTREDVQLVLERLGELEESEKDPAGGNEPGGESPSDRLRTLASQLEDRLTELERRLWTPPRTKGIVAERTVWDHLGTARRFLGSAWDPPSPGQLAYLERAEAMARSVLVDLNAFYAGRVAEFRSGVREAGIELLREREALELPERR